jgi:hypothetical protein
MSSTPYCPAGTKNDLSKYLFSLGSWRVIDTPCGHVQLSVLII